MIATDRILAAPSGPAQPIRPFLELFMSPTWPVNWATPVVRSSVVRWQAGYSGNLVLSDGPVQCLADTCGGWMCSLSRGFVNMAIGTMSITVEHKAERANGKARGVSAAKHATGVHIMWSQQHLPGQVRPQASRYIPSCKG